jgi:hypothetical protein
MRAAAAVVVGVVIGAVGALTAQKLMTEGTSLPPPPPPSTTTMPTPASPLPSPMCDALVRIKLDGLGRPTLTPKDVCLARGRELTWDVDPQLVAGEVDIDFDFQGSDKGPFLDKTGTNPHQALGRGRYVRRNADSRPIRSNDAEKTGRWTYKVTYTPNGGQPMVADPAVCVRD